MRTRSLVTTTFLTLTLLLSTAAASLAAPAPAKHIQEKCLLGIGLNGERTDTLQCLLYRLPVGSNKADLKRLEVVGISVGADGMLLEQPQTVDATNPNAVVSGTGRMQSGQAKEFTVTPAQVAGYCDGADIIFYEGIYNSGDSVCVYPNTYPYYKFSMATLYSFSHPGGWDNIVSAYESRTQNCNIVLYVDPNNTGDAMGIPSTYPYALDWIDAQGGSPNYPYTWNDRLSSFIIY